MPETVATGASIIPMPGEAHHFVADKERKAREAERTRQIIIEADLKASLIRECKVHTHLELPVFGPLTREATREEAWRKEFQGKIRQDAWAIVHVRGS